MDYKKQSFELKLRHKYDRMGVIQLSKDLCKDCFEAAKSIDELLARAEAAERKAEELSEALSSASKVVRTMQENTIPYYRKRAEAAEKEVEWKNKVIEAAERRFMAAEARAEKAEAERDAAVSDMEALMCNCVDGCYVCANAIVVQIEPCVRLDCSLKGQGCNPKWRGAKEE